MRSVELRKMVGERDRVKLHRQQGAVGILDAVLTLPENLLKETEHE